MSSPKRARSGSVQDTWTPVQIGSPATPRSEFQLYAETVLSPLQNSNDASSPMPNPGALRIPTSNEWLHYALFDENDNSVTTSSGSVSNSYVSLIQYA